jgi:predicted ArsR family transcriptional regulator
LEKYKSYFSSSLDRFLYLLKKAGPLTAAQIAQELGITAEGARFQLQKLAEEGLVQAENANKGVGRPQQVWQLTAKGNTRFPDAHAELSQHLIEAVKSLLGEQVLDDLINRREMMVREKYRQAVAPLPTLEEKIAAVAVLRSSEGYIADFSRDESGFLLVENHCPICAAAASCEKICHSELDTLQEVLGEAVHVERLEHLLKGGRRCVYRIQEI